MRKLAQDELLALPNVGPSIREDLRRLGVNSLATLAEQDADELYVRIGRMDGRFHDPCLWDTFAAIIDMAEGRASGGVVDLHAPAQGPAGEGRLPLKALRSAASAAASALRPPAARPAPDRRGGR